MSERLLLYQHHKIKHSGITLPMSSLVSPKTFDSDTVTDNFSCSTLQCFVSYFLLPWDTKVAELSRADDQKRENTRGNQRQSGKKPKLIFQLYANSNLQKELNIEIFFNIWWSHSIYHTHTQMNHLAFFFFLIQKSCAGDCAPSCWYRSWMESSGMAQCRCQKSK